jgi:hypothetical protein
MSANNGHRKAKAQFSTVAANGDLLPPHSIPDEMGLLGSILLAPEILDAVRREGVIGPWFYDLRHALWFNLLSNMQSKSEGIDAVTVAGRISSSSQRSEFGDPHYFFDLQNASPSAHNWSYYIPKLRSCYVRRRTLQALASATEIALDESRSSQSLLADLAASVEAISKSPQTLPAIEDGCAFVDTDIELPVEIVKGLLHVGLKFSLGGGSKTCKSWVLLDLAISLATGADWLGLQTVRSKVLFVNLEIPRPFFRKRMAKICKVKDVSLEPGWLDVWNLRGMEASADILLPKIIERARDSAYSLIILDPIYKTYGNLKENAAEDMTQLMARFERLSHETHAAVGFAAHFSKGNQAQKDALDRISGSGVFARDPDTCITMTALEKDATFAFEANGLRNLPPFKPFGIKWQYPLMRRDDSIDPSKLKKPGGKPKAYDEAKITSLLSEKPLTTVEWQKLTFSELGYSRASFYRSIRDIESSGFASKSKSDETWHLNPKFNQPPAYPEMPD